MTARRGVLLDIGGTLAGSNDAHARAWQQALAEHHYRVDLGRIRRWIGMGGDKLLPEATGGLDPEGVTGRAIAKRRGEIFRQRYLTGIAGFPRCRDLLVRMKHDGLALVAASSASEEELGPLLARCGVRDLLRAETSSDDAER